MEVDTKFTFLPQDEAKYVEINEKRTQDTLRKWGILGNYTVQTFSFNEPYRQYQKYEIAEAFFQDDIVAKTLLSKQGDAWIQRGIRTKNVQIKQVPCTVRSMAFFDRIKDPANGIVYKSGTIQKRQDLQVEDFLVSDNLRSMLLDETSEEYSLYSEEESREFIFRLFQMLVLGGILCQYEDVVQPYLDVTRSIYKDIIRTHRNKDADETSITTIVLEVIAKDETGKDFFPSNSHHKQNLAFLLIHPNSREITTFVHQYGGYCN